MKCLIILILLPFSIPCFSQTDSTYANFVELIKKVQDDNTLRGTFMYKGYKVNIGEYEELKTTIGKYIQIYWQVISDGRPTFYTAIYHNKLGYMTRTLFENYLKYYTKDYKVDKDKYCRQNTCIVLLTDQDLPCIVTYPYQSNEIKEIK